MENTLNAQIRNSIKNVPNITELSKPQADDIVDRVGQRFVSDVKTLWWWGSLKSPGKIFEYVESEFSDQLRRYIDEDESIYLAVTDDEPRPWPVFKGPFGKIMKLVMEQRFF